MINENEFGSDNIDMNLDLNPNQNQGNYENNQADINNNGTGNINSFSEKPNITLDSNNYGGENHIEAINQINSNQKEQQNGVINMPPIEVDIQQSQLETNQLSTLEEPVLETLKRDLFRIYNKVKHVVLPRSASKKFEELYNWDLWGPLIFCFLLSTALSTGDHSNDDSSVFVLIFVIFWLGGTVITINGKFLGAKIGICQMICLLGYCMFPITIAGMIIGFLGIKKTWIKTILVFIALIWSCFASLGFISGIVTQDKKVIIVLPIFLFFLSLGLFVLNY